MAAADKHAVRVWFLSNEHKTVAIGSETTAMELRDVIADKIGLKEKDLFEVWCVCPELEIPLNPDERVLDVLNSWDQFYYAYTEPSTAVDANGKALLKPVPKPTMHFRNAQILNRDLEENIADPVAIRLLFSQANEHVVSGRYPVSQEEIIRLVGLRLQGLCASDVVVVGIGSGVERVSVQEAYGDHNSQRQDAGFVANEIQHFLPDYLYKARTPLEWEADIVRYYQALTGKTRYDAQRLFLDSVRRLEYYGCTFYDAILEDVLAMVKRRRDVRVGINNTGIFLFDRKRKSLISKHRYADIVSWEAKEWMFLFEAYVVSERGVEHADEFLLETHQGLLIDHNVEAQIAVWNAAQESIKAKVKSAKKAHRHSHGSHKDRKGGAHTDSGAGAASLS